MVKFNSYGTVEWSLVPVVELNFLAKLNTNGNVELYSQSFFFGWQSRVDLISCGKVEFQWQR